MGPFLTGDLLSLVLTCPLLSVTDDSDLLVLSALTLFSAVTELLLLIEDLPRSGDVTLPTAELTGDLTCGDTLLTVGDCTVTKLVLLVVLVDDTLRRLSDTGDVG